MATNIGWRPLRKTARLQLGKTPFSRLAVAHVLATSGDTLVTMALAGSLFFSISPNAARERIAAYLLLTMAPFAVVAPFLGPMLDRNRGGRRTMMIAAAGGRAVVCLLMADQLDTFLLFPAAFAVLVLSKAHMVTKSSLVPATVGDHGGLVEANSRLAVVAVVAGFVAAIPGAAVLKIPFLGAPWVVRLAALVFAAAAVASFRLVRSQNGSSPIPPEEIKAELHAATIRLSVTAMAVLRGCAGFLVFLAAFALRRDDSPAWWYGLIIASSLCGSFVGAAVAPRLRRALPEERMLTGALVVVIGAGLFAARVGGNLGLAVLAAALGVGAAAGKLAFDSIVQRDAPDALRGRTFARFETRFQLVWVLGAAVPVVIPIDAVLGVLLVAGVSLVALVMYLGGLKATHRKHAHQPEPPGKARGAS